MSIFVSCLYLCARQFIFSESEMSVLELQSFCAVFAFSLLFHETLFNKSLHQDLMLFILKRRDKYWYDNDDDVPSIQNAVFLSVWKLEAALTRCRTMVEFTFRNKTHKTAVLNMAKERERFCVYLYTWHSTKEYNL